MMSKSYLTGSTAVSLLFLFFLAVTPVQSSIIHVKPDGNDGNSGLTWESAKKTVQAGMEAAAAGDEVWVAAGTYVERVTMKAGVAMYGGFSGSETARDQRDWRKNRTVLDGDHGGSVVTVPSGSTVTTVIDGFTITNGGAGPGSVIVVGGGIFCNGGAATISNNIISGNSAMAGGGVLCGSTAPSVIRNNMILGNSSEWQGGGISCAGGPHLISHNVIADNTTEGPGGGISCAGSAIVSDNVVVGNCALGDMGSRLAGGGIYCRSFSGVISGNRIVGNVADRRNGGGIAIISPPSFATIIRNSLVGNSATDDYDLPGCGGGLCCIGNATPLIAENCFLVNSASMGAAVCLERASPEFVNNTLAWNNAAQNGGGIYFKNFASPKIANNIIAFGSSGICGEGGTPMLSHNCVFDNTAYDYSGVQPGTGDISANPKLASADLGDAHIQPGSPCINAGDDSCVAADSVDIDGQPRVIGSGVDIGADESDGTVWNPTARRIYVDPTASDGGDGTGWQTAYRSIGDALSSAASHFGAEIWVAKGTFYEQVRLQPFTHLYGGFSGNESSRDERDVHRNLSVIDASRIPDSQIDRNAVVGAEFSTIDGFVITNGYAGVWCERTSPTISNNTIIANYEGIRCRHGSPVISGNRIVGNYEGVSCPEGSPTVTGNIITGHYDGVYCGPGNARVTNNVLVGNMKGVDAYYGSPTVTNNTIVASGEEGILNIYGGAVISNNIVAFGRRGVSVSDSTAVLSHNDVFGNKEDYVGISAGESDISADPMFASLRYGNLHIQPGSPCIDAGSTSALGLPSVDLDGQSRMQGDSVDIGADESDGTAWSEIGRVVYVKASASDGGDGASWETAYTNLDDAVQDVAVNGGADVWVSEGTYTAVPVRYPPFGTSIRLAPFTHLYGGFVGNETAFEQRDFERNITVVEGDRNDWRSYGAISAANISTVDGFTATNSNFGVYCDRCSAVVANNKLAGNVYAGVGAYASSPLIYRNVMTGSKYGVVCGEDSSPTIACNIIAGNTDSGVWCYDGSPTIVNNTIVGSVYGVSCYHSSAPTIANNILAFSGTGVARIVSKWDPPVSPILRNNDLFGNTDDYLEVAAGEGDICVDPMFRNAQAGDYRLLPDSLCINAGWNDAPGLPSFDFGGDPRIAMGLADIGAYECQPRAVRIDVRPGEYPNYINTRSRGLVAVGILSGDGFDATRVDPSSVQFAGASVATRGGGVMAAKRDADGDGVTDLVVQFESQGLKLAAGARDARLIGRIPGADWVEGSDSVVVVR